MTNQEIAKHIFARQPKLEEIHISSDGQAFYEKHQAEGHAGRLKDTKVESINATADAVEPEAPAFDADPIIVELLDGNVATVSEKVKAVQTAAELEIITAHEKAGANRKGVSEAIAARHIELTESNSQPQK
jgi:hypothetical protein